MRSNVSGSVSSQLRRSAGTPQRVDTLLRLYEVRGSQRGIDDFYELVEEIGSGAFGSVSRYRPLQTRAAQSAGDVAVKHIKWGTVWHGFWRDPEQEELMRRELKMLMVLDNPFIIRVREWFEDPARGIYFVMELCDGGSLQDVLDAVCLEPSREVRVRDHEGRLRRHFREMSYALQYLHSMEPPIAHCDLKPENALLKTKDPSSCIKLIDFGLVSLENAQEKNDKWTKGTQIFMAPEQFLQGDGHFSTQMDVWALGVIFTWIISALEMGSLQHPMLSKEDGVGFQPNFLDLNHAYRGIEEHVGQPVWRRELFGDQAQSAFDLADRMLLTPAEMRITTREISSHEWTVDGGETSGLLVNQENIVLNMRMYPKLNKFERTLLNLVAGRVSAHVGEASEVVLKLRDLFRALDTTGNGRLSKAELLAGMASERMGAQQEEELEEELTALFEKLGQLKDDEAQDNTPEETTPSGGGIWSVFSGMIGEKGETDSGVVQTLSSGMFGGNSPLASPTSKRGPMFDDQPALCSVGQEKTTLSYTEWLAATIGPSVLTSADALNEAFHELDASHQGILTREDLVRALGSHEADRVLAEACGPNARHLTFEDFKAIAAKTAAKRWTIDMCPLPPSGSPSRASTASVSPIMEDSDDEMTARPSLWKAFRRSNTVAEFAGVFMSRDDMYAFKSEPGPALKFRERRRSSTSSIDSCDSPRLATWRSAPAGALLPAAAAALGDRLQLGSAKDGQALVPTAQ